jgi:AcrR family transcriptional regulator
VTTRRRQSTTRRDLVSNQILERAAALFAERGFANTSLQEVADALEISRPALYHYIRSKDDLLAALVHGITQQTAASLGEIAADGDLDPVQKLDRAIRDMVQRIAANPARFRLLVASEEMLPAPLAEEHREARRLALQHLSDVIQSGIDAGALRRVDASIAAFAILGMCNWVAQWYSADRKGAPAPERVADELAAIGIAGLSAEGGASASGDGVASALARLRDDIDDLERRLTRPRARARRSA